MRRVLLAASQDWDGTARMPSLLARAGLVVDLLAPQGFLVERSSHVDRHFAATGGVSEVARQAIERAAGYERVVIADEALLVDLGASSDAAAAALLPTRGPEALRDAMDKTRFPLVASAGGIPVPESQVIEARDASVETDRLEFPLVVKSAMGQAGRSVRLARDELELRAATAELPGPPWVVQRLVGGRLALAACLYESGRLVASFVAEKTRTRGRFGPSAVNRLREVPDGLARQLERIGEVFGLHGFAGVDFMTEGEEERTVFLEINPRPIPQLHLGRRVGVDMSAALRAALEGRTSGRPLTPARSGRIAPLFPQEVARCRAEGDRRGLLRCAVDPRLWADLPWDDPGLLRAYLPGRRGS